VPMPAAGVQSLVSHYGLAAVLVGTFLEGEAVLLTAGVLAERGLLHPVSVWLVAALGSGAGHLAFFSLARLAASRSAVSAALRRYRLTARVRRVDALVRRHPTATIFALQYLYGVRIVGALALGFTTLSWRRFLVTEASSCLLWAALFTATGYATGEVAMRIFGGWLRWLWMALSAVAFLGALHLLSRRASGHLAGPPRG
jgi:membrane protein DedA with SNARE-associated domain